MDITLPREENIIGFDVEQNSISRNAKLFFFWTNACDLGGHSTGVRRLTNCMNFCGCAVILQREGICRRKLKLDAGVPMDLTGFGISP